MNLKSTIENYIVDDMSPKQIKFLTAVRPDEASGLLAEIYQQARRDFQLAPPITLFSPAPDLLAAVWSITRESQIADGLISRANKEAVAAAVSSINTCTYCVDAHVGMLHGKAAHSTANAILHSDIHSVNDPQTRAYIEWSQATRSPDSPVLKTPPFNAKEAAEMIGTALSYHFVNRLVAIFLTASPLPVHTGSAKVRKIATRIFGATAGKSISNKQPGAGDSLKFLPTAELPEAFSWAKPQPHISAAFAGFSSLMENAGYETVPDEVRECLLQHLRKWRGEEMGLSRQWLEDAIYSLKDEHKDLARLAFLSAFSPDQVDEKLMTNFRKYYPSDGELLSVASWASYAAVRQISGWLTPVYTVTSISPTAAKFAATGA